MADAERRPTSDDFAAMGLDRLEQAIDPYSSSPTRIRAALGYLLDKGRGRNIELGDPEVWALRVCRDGTSAAKEILFDEFPLSGDALLALAETYPHDIYRDKALKAWFFRKDTLTGDRAEKFFELDDHGRGVIITEATMERPSSRRSHPNAGRHRDPWAVHDVIRLSTVGDQPGEMNESRLLMFARHSKLFGTARLAATRLMAHNADWIPKLWTTCGAGARRAVITHIANDFRDTSDRHRLYDRLGVNQVERKLLDLGVKYNINKNTPRFGPVQAPSMSGSAISGAAAGSAVRHDVGGAARIRGGAAVGVAAASTARHGDDPRAGAWAGGTGVGAAASGDGHAVAQAKRPGGDPWATAHTPARSPAGPARTLADTERSLPEPNHL